MIFIKKKKKNDRHDVRRVAFRRVTDERGGVKTSARSDSGISLSFAHWGIYGLCECPCQWSPLFGHIEKLREFSQWTMTTAMKGLVRNVTSRRLLAVVFSLILCNLNVVQAARGFRHSFKQGKFLPVTATSSFIVFELWFIYLEILLN